MRQPRCKSFDFCPEDFLHDQRVQVMTSEQRGAYVCLILAAWQSEVPGVLPADRAALARLACCTPEEWNRCEEAVGRCFDRSDGRWVHHRVCRDYAAQSMRISRASKAGKRAIEARWSQVREQQQDNTTRTTNVIPPSSFTPSLLPPEEESKPTHTPKVGIEGGRSKRASLLKEWLETFDEHFWPNYPRKVAKEAARASWKRLAPSGASLHDLELLAGHILDGLDHHRRTLFDAAPADKIPYPATWLNQRRYTDVAQLHAAISERESESHKAADLEFLQQKGRRP